MEMDMVIFIPAALGLAPRVLSFLFAEARSLALLYSSYLDIIDT
jgi:hypothetical protein